MSSNSLWEMTAMRSARYVEQIKKRRVVPTPDDIANLDALGGTWNDLGLDPEEVIEQLDTFGSPATVAATGPRYFGFITGGSLHASMAANWLAAVWGQNGSMSVQSPVATGVAAIAANPVVAQVQVTIGGQPATVVYAGLAPSFVGLYQLNVLVPAGVTGDLPIVVSVGGSPATGRAAIPVH